MTQPLKLKSSVKPGSGANRASSVSLFDSKALAGQLVSGLKGPIQKILSQPKTKGDRVEQMLKTIQSRLEKQLGVLVALDMGKPLAKRVVTNTPGQIKRIAEPLPVENLKPADVIARGLLDMSAASLYRAVVEKKFYSVAPKGLSNGRLFPAWQFVDPVPDLLAPVLAALADNPPRSVHAFLVSTADELNELAPAEVLAGRPMATRGKLHASQERLLSLPAAKRQELVADQIGVVRE